MALPTLPTLPTDAATNPGAQQQYIDALTRLSSSFDNRNNTNWFSVAGALLDPGRTGSFGEGIGRAASVMGQQQQAQLERAPAIAQLKMQIEGQKYEVQSRADAMKMLGLAIGASPTDVAQTLQGGSATAAGAEPTATTTTAAKLQNIDPKVYLQIAAKNPTVGAMVKDFAGMTNEQIKTQIAQDQLTETKSQNAIGNQFKGLELQNAKFDLEIKLLKAGDDQDAKRRAQAEFIDKVGPVAAKEYGIEITPPKVMPTVPLATIPGAQPAPGGPQSGAPMITPSPASAMPQAPQPAIPAPQPAMAAPQPAPARSLPMGPAAAAEPSALRPAAAPMQQQNSAAIINTLTASREKLSTVMDMAVKSGNRQMQAVLGPQLAEIDKLLAQVGGQNTAQQAPAQQAPQPQLMPQQRQVAGTDSPAVQRALAQKAGEAQIGVETKSAETQLKPFNDRIAALNRFSPTVSSQAINNMSTLRQIAAGPEGQIVFGQLQARDIDTVIQRAAKAVGQMLNTGVGMGHFGHANIPVADLVSNLKLDDNQKLLATRVFNAIAEETVANLSLNREAIGGRLSNYEDQQLSAAIANTGNLPEAIYYWAGKRLLQHQNEAKIVDIYGAWNEANPGASAKNPRAFFRHPEYTQQNSNYLNALTGLDQLLLKKK